VDPAVFELRPECRHLRAAAAFANGVTKKAVRGVGEEQRVSDVHPGSTRAACPVTLGALTRVELCSAPNVSSEWLLVQRGLRPVLPDADEVHQVRDVRRRERPTVALAPRRHRGSGATLADGVAQEGIRDGTEEGAMPKSWRFVGLVALPSPAVTHGAHPAV